MRIHPPRSRRSASVLLLGALTTALPHGSALAQTVSEILGTVTTADGAALAGAQVFVPAISAGVLAGPGGRYSLSGLAPGSWMVEVRHIGYRTAVRTVQVVEGGEILWDVRLELEPVALAPLEVEAASGSAATPQLEGFHERRERGGGYYFTRAQIERMNARDLTDVLRRVPGARITQTPGPFGSTQVLQLSRTLGTSGTAPCPILYYMNGVAFPLRGDIGIDAYVRAADVEAVEVYNGTARVPAEFSSGLQSTRCGVVVIWTRAGQGRSGLRPPEA